MADRSQGILLDSSVIIAHFRGKLDLFQLVAPGEPLFMPLVALGELWKGALKSADPPKHQAKIKALLKIVAVLNPDSATAEQYVPVRRLPWNPRGSRSPKTTSGSPPLLWNWICRWPPVTPTSTASKG